MRRGLLGVLTTLLVTALEPAVTSAQQDSGLDEEESQTNVGGRTIRIGLRYEF